MAMLIQTERLRLRSWKESDLKPFAVMNADPKVREYFPSVLTSEQSDADVAAIQNEINKKGFGFWAIELVHGGDFIGFCGLHDVSLQSHFTPCVEIGWRLAVPYWGRGYATEAAQAALQYGFEKLILPEIVALTAVANWRSRRVMEKIGMHRNPKDDFDHPNIADGHPLRRHVLYRISPS